MFVVININTELRYNQALCLFSSSMHVSGEQRLVQVHEHILYISWEIPIISYEPVNDTTRSHRVVRLSLSQIEDAVVDLSGYMLDVTEEAALESHPFFL